MDSFTLSAHAKSQGARAERLYLHYAFTLAALFAITGAILAVLALSDRLDMLVKGDGGLDARLLNAAPGIALCLAAAILAVVSRPGRLPAPVATSAPADVLELSNERALSARIGARYAANAPVAETAGPSRFMFNHTAGNLADALEQSALKAFAAWQKSRDRTLASPDPGKAAPVTADT